MENKRDYKFEFDKVIEQFRQHKIRVTPQRQAIVKFIVESTDHPTAEDIYDALKPDFTSMSFATVYNTLNLMREHGLIKAINIKDSPTRFDYNDEEHYHLYCIKCGRIDDLYYPVFDKLDEELERVSGYSIQSHDLKIKGICPDCQKEK